MIPDILVRLRGVTDRDGQTSPIAAEAADEIEQLRTALDRIRLTEGCPRSIERIALNALKR